MRPEFKKRIEDAIKKRNADPIETLRILAVDDTIARACLACLDGGRSPTETICTALLYYAESRDALHSKLNRAAEICSIDQWAYVTRDAVER